MNGEALYSMYEDAMSDNNVGIDPWEDLREKDQAVWNLLAERVERDLLGPTDREGRR